MKITRAYIFNYHRLLNMMINTFELSYGESQWL